MSTELQVHLQALVSELTRTARRTSRRDHEVPDLVQEALLQALQQGCTPPQWPQRRAYLHGIVKKQALSAARSAVRRQARHQRAGLFEPSSTEAVPSSSFSAGPPLPLTFVRGLPPALRVLACLLAADLSATELGAILGLKPEALRQRVASLRRRLRARRAALQGREGAAGATLPRPRPLGPRRPALLALLRRHRHAAVLATDPDGHVIGVRLAGAPFGRGQIRAENDHAAGPGGNSPAPAPNTPPAGAST